MAVNSPAVGRKPSKNPKQVHLGIRIDQSTADSIDAEIERLKKAHPGLAIGRSDVVRMFITEALSSRPKTKK